MKIEPVGTLCYRVAETELRDWLGNTVYVGITVVDIQLQVRVRELAAAIEIRTMRRLRRSMPELGRGNRRLDEHTRDPS